MEATHSSYTTAHEITVTVAPFRAWRGSQFIVAREPKRVTIIALEHTWTDVRSRVGYFAAKVMRMQV